MAVKKINVIPWEEALQLYSKTGDKQNTELLKILNEISQLLEKDNKDYVYHLKLPFGEKIIERGNLSIDSVNVRDNKFGKTKEDFLTDIQYSTDPLGIVLSNYLEVYTENISNACKYTFPLNLLEQGDFFGVFGVLDYVSKIATFSTNRDWYVRAGNVSFSLAFPFHNRNEIQLLEDNNFDHLSGKNEKAEHSPGDNKVEFIKRYVDDWFVDIAYFPQHFFDKIPNDLKLKFHNQLFQIGWNQSSTMRNNLFEDTTIDDMLSSPHIKLKHEKTFLNILYRYIKNSSLGNAYVMKPLLDNHIINIALKRFKKHNENYFSSTKSYEPLAFIFTRLQNEKDWGLVSAYHLPIMYNYEIHSLNNLLNDIDDLNKKIERNIYIQNDYKLQQLEGFGNTGGRSVVKLNKTDVIRKKLSKIFGVSINKVNLNSKEFSNLLLIKSQNNNVS